MKKNSFVVEVTCDSCGKTLTGDEHKVFSNWYNVHMKLAPDPENLFGADDTKDFCCLACFKAFVAKL